MRAILPILIAASAAAGGPSESVSPDGSIRWTRGASEYAFTTRKGKEKRRRLPAVPKGEGWSRRLLFSEKGNFFCVLDEKNEELGLHLGGRRGPAAAKLAVSASILTLVRTGGRALWKKRLRDRHFGGPKTKDDLPLQIAEDGTLAVLLQDGDPYAKSRPVVLVVDPRGKKKLELGYTVWSRVDELALSEDGKELSVRGLGRIPDREDWGRAVGNYRLDSDRSWVNAVDDSGRSLGRSR
jgi:hypothetical protein